MLKRPGERKQILADLLKLDHYDRLAEQAKEQARDYKAQVKLLEASLTQLTAQLQQRGAIATTYRDLQARLETAQQTYAEQQATLEQWQQQQQQCQAWQQQLTLEQQQLSHVQATLAASTQQLEQIQTQAAALQARLDRTDEIETGYRQLQQLQVAEEQAALKFQAYQLAQEKRNRLQQHKHQTLQPLQAETQHLQHQLQSLGEQIEELQCTLQKQPEVAAALAQLQQARQRLQTLDQQQLQVLPLRQRQQQLQTQRQREEARLAARLEEIIHAETQLQLEQAQQPQLLQSATEVSHRLEYLEQRRAYQEQVRLKGQERRNFMERLQADQRNYEIQLAQLDQKLQLLSAPHAVCPLCDQPLQAHGDRVLAQQQQQRQEIQDQIWVIREQLAVSEREIQVLRREYREIEVELTQITEVLQQRGRLQVQMQSASEGIHRLQQLETERQQLTQCLHTCDYATPLHQELQTLERQLNQLAYDERDHALARNQVDKLRWAELKQTELQQADRRLRQLTRQRPELEARYQDRQAQLATQAAALQQQLQGLDQQLAQLDYSVEAHSQLRQQLRAARAWQPLYQELQQAQTQLPTLHQRQQVLQTQRAEQQQLVDAIATRICQLEQQLAAQPDLPPQIERLSEQIQAYQAQRDRDQAQLGRLQQQLTQLDQQQAQADQQQQALHLARRQHRVHQALAQAFGKNGIQALMIENLLPQLEAETNQLLGRLSAHQLHVQFVTQRSSRSQHKLIDTLDILIADTHGTRPYETYSGGEAFRVNFAIRLALARLLAQRSGLALQMLIVDEGFGTQDHASCDRLIAAINAIAPDFACILTVTHMPHFREAFQNRIDVCKTEMGSCLELS
jgi:exonuclease SbcC